jgi:ElaB/YqjD/DUF883 family membrane-anchored ribosome-binding protein
MAQAGQGSGSGKRLAEQASETLDDAASKAQEKAVALKEQGSDRVRQQFDQRSTQAGKQVRSVAGALRRANEQLAQEGGSTTQLTGQVADRIDRLGAYLERASSDELIRDVESFARRRPWILAGMGTLAGLAAARFVKASSEQRWGSYRQGATVNAAQAGSRAPANVVSQRASSSQADALDEPAGAQPPAPGQRHTEVRSELTRAR